MLGLKLSRAIVFCGFLQYLPANSIVTRPGQPLPHTVLCNSSLTDHPTIDSDNAQTQTMQKD
jgi:hypothetical protein